MRSAFLSVLYTSLYSSSAHAFEEQLVPLNEPEITYPIIESARVLEADCETVFDLSDEGLPINIEVECTHTAFVRATKRAIASLHYPPKSVSRPEVKRTNYRYPISFRIDGS